MSTFLRLVLIVALVGLASGCEKSSFASTDVDAGFQAARSVNSATSATDDNDQPPNAILGRGDANFLARFIDSRTIVSSEIFEVAGRIHIGGTAAPAGRLQISDNFAGFGPTGQILNIHQLDPTGNINIEFSQSGFGVLGDVGVIRSSGPERFAILSRGRNPRGIPLSLAEDGSNVGIGNIDPLAKLDVIGDVAIRGTGNTCCALHVQNDFPGGGTLVNIHQVNPTGNNVLEFSQAGFGVLGDVGVVRAGGPERFVVLSSARNPRRLPLALAEGEGNVGIGTADPRTKLDVVGNTSISGNLSVTGTKSSVATLSDGRRVLLYAIESPQNWFEDFGTAQLGDGEAWVSLEGVFAETVNTDANYHVFLTPNGNCRGLYIAEKRPDGFLVREIGGGRSTVSFDYRIVAPRRGFESVRLVELP